jgi:multidrug resistance protein, MATE family
MDIAAVFSRAEIKRQMTLAWPVMLATGQWVLLNLIDTAMVGHSGTQELAFMNAGRILVWTAIMISFGLLSAVIVFVSRADGAKEFTKCGEYLRQGLQYAAALGIGIALFLFFAAEPLLEVVGIPADQSKGGAAFVHIMALALLFRIIGLPFAYFLEGISRPRVVMILALATLPLNAGLNWIFVFGNWGFPEMGAKGAALGTMLAIICEEIAMFCYLILMKDRARYGISGRLFGPWQGVWLRGRELRFFGLAPGLTAGLEIVGFSILGIVAAQISMEAAASFQAVNALHSLALCIPVGLASAAGVRVGNAVGERAIGDIANRGWLATSLAAIGTLIAVITFVLMPHFWLSLFSETDVNMLKLGQIMLLWTVPFIVFDAIQIVLVYALRAAGDPVFAALNQGISCLLIMGGGGWFAVNNLNMGPLGVTAGLGAGVTVSAVLMVARFYWINRHNAAWILAKNSVVTA